MRRLRLLIALGLILCGAPHLDTQQQPLRIHIVDVGQGDGVLIQSPSGQNVVYDGGANPTRMREYLAGLGVSQVGLVIASHNRADHIGGLAEVVRFFRPAFFMDNHVQPATETYAGLLQAVKTAGSQRLEPTSRRLVLGDAVLRVVPPPRIAEWDQGDNSIGIIVEYGDFRLSLGGDAEPREWAWWMTHHRELLGAVHVHKASNHGANQGDTAAAVGQLSPEVVVVSAGRGNVSGHPEAEALRLYSEQGAAVYRTDVHGTIVIEAQPSGQYSVRVERGQETSPNPDTPAPTPGAPSPVVSLLSLAAVSERESNGNLRYAVTFQLRESGGAAATLLPFTATMALPGGVTLTGTVSPVDAFGSSTIEAGATVTSKRLLLQSGTPAQATGIAVRVPWSTQAGISGTAEAASSITPAPCTTVGTPAGLRVLVSGSAVIFGWSAASGWPTDYLLAIGTVRGATDVDTKSVSETSFRWTAVPAGTYYARVSARDACGIAGKPSNEVMFTVGGG